MPVTSLAKKLKLKPGLKAAVIHRPENYLDGLQQDGEISSALRGKFDWIQIFVRNKAELDRLAPKAAKTLKPDSLLWISFPKGTSRVQTDLTRDKAYYREKVKTLSGRTDVARTRPCENRVWRGSGAAAKRSCRGWQQTTRQGPAGNPGINLVHPRSSLNILYSK